ncbi:protein STRUBBELIG-RECEPTOR FAMILY 6-like isoform X2 [Asparagus officinalis]|uniref:protein STRUBBELIG-RECEPTOR FAMILY 6-like isoform X2 n=1 Tax=Asparagus officinalis TaxID=4686 RepID=UPI00098E6CCF|nr:protein STRUBBELIG-RECEPTOR FAMILY 6-like isoform X2 [Asparagus officinalis]
MIFGSVIKQGVNYLDFGSGREREREMREKLSIWALLACIWALNSSSVNGSTDQSDVTPLNTLFSSLHSPGKLSGWKQNGGDPCGESWKGITCSGSSVTEIKLSGLGLTGTLAYNMDSMKSLVELDMSTNSLGNGGQIPYNLPPNLKRLNLASNQFAQVIPYSITLMHALEYLDLSFNSLTGDLPQNFNQLSSLTTLHLQNNQFTGSINVLVSLPLEDLNVANNHFSGWIPNQLKKINNLQTDGNSWNNGPAPPPPPFTPPPSRKVDPGSNSGGEDGPSGGKKSSGIGGGGIAGIIISLLVVGAIVAFFLVKRRKQKSSIRGHHEQDQPFTPLASNEAKAAPVNLKPPAIDRHKSFVEDELSNKPVAKKTKSAPIKATVYSVADLQVATDSFSLDNLVGEGSVGRVYKAQFNGGKVLAVKKINSSALPSNSSEDFIDLVSNISLLHHPNITELVGYCSEHGQHLLVYEFQKNGSLHDLLHLSDEDSKLLSWNTRVKIALGTARALEYLHEVCSPSFVHKNFKSANILLDMELNPHLSDSGLASLIPDAEYQALDHNMASGYGAPEVAMSGQYTLKSDIYSFGVVMLELLTGRKPFDSTRPWSEQSLVRWAAPQLHDIDALDKMVDPALQGLYPGKSLSRFADVVALCVQPEPEFRPPMSEVVQALVRLVQRANMSKRMLGREGNDSGKRIDDTKTQDYMY